MLFIRQIGVLLVLLSFWINIALISPCYAADSEEKSHSFLSQWSLMKQEEKTLFISGYLHGFTDAARVIDISIDYIQKNPKNAADSLKKIRRVYDVSSVEAEQAAREIDKFYKDPLNSNAPLSRVVTMLSSKK